MSTTRLSLYLPVVCQDQLFDLSSYDIESGFCFCLFACLLLVIMSLTVIRGVCEWILRLTRIHSPESWPGENSIIFLCILVPDPPVSVSPDLCQISGVWDDKDRRCWVLSAFQEKGTSVSSKAPAVVLIGWELAGTLNLEPHPETILLETWWVWNARAHAQS